MFSFRAAIAAVALAAAAPAQASSAEWVIVPELSQIEFQFEINGQTEIGHFDEFGGEGRFDLTQPKDARLSVEIAANSIDVGGSVENAYATSAEWFDARNFPKVTYHLVRLDPQGDGTYVAIGDITIRGEAVTLRTPITLTIDGDVARATGTLYVDRRRHLLGVGPAELFVDIGQTVAVRFDLTARPAL